MSDAIQFDQLPESKETKFVKTAGIHIGFHLDKVELVQASEKDGKKISGSLRVTFKNDDGETFQAMVWEPNSKPEDVKFFGDVWENGKVVRKRTAQEEIREGFNNLFYFYEQLAKCSQAAPETLMQFRKSISGTPEQLWAKMYESFVKFFPMDKYKGKLLDFKTIFNNNNNNRTSFLQLGRASATNLVMAATIDKDKKENSVLQQQEWEISKGYFTRKYNPQDRAPQGTATEAGEWTPGGTDAAAAPAQSNLGTGMPPVTNNATDEGDFF